MTVNGQKVSTDSFLAMFGLQRPLAHEPWHIQPLGAAPTADNPDPSAKAPMVADASGKAVNLESGKTEAIQEKPPAAAGGAPQGGPTPIGAGTPPAAVAAAGDEAKKEAAASADSMVASASPSSADPLATTQTPTPGATGADPLAVAQTPTPGAAGTDPLATTQTATPGVDLDGKPLPQQQITPVANQTGTQVAKDSAQLETSKMVAQASPPAPVVVNNQSGGSQQPVQQPKTQMPKASSRSSESTFNRALAKDFSHPTAFTSVSAA